MRRIVVTGMGAITPLGSNLDYSWKSIIESKSGIDRIASFDSEEYACRVAGEVPLTGSAAFNIDDYTSHKDQRKMDKFIIYAIAAATQAVEDSGWVAYSDEDKFRTGVIIGSGIGGLDLISKSAVTLHEKGARKVSPFFITGSLINLPSGHVSIKYGFKGPNHSVVTACATGTHAIGDAANIIARGDADIMIAGGTEAAVCPLGIAGFSAIRALSTKYNDTPQKASRPWDRDRDGFIMGEGSGILVLEEYEHAKARNAKIYAEVAGYGLSSDAYHITAPAADGDGGFRAMQMALKNSGLSLTDIDYINAHGTSTPLGDEIELNAVKRLFADEVGGIAMSSTKSAIGHLLGAAGAVEAIFSIKAMNDNIVPPTLNLNDPCDGAENINLVANIAQDRKINAALSNSFGFGGTNASLIFKKI